MKLGQKHKPSQRQLLRYQLNPKLIQMMKTFQESYTDLLETVKEELKENVLLEVTQYDQLSEWSSKQRKSTSSTSEHLEALVGDIKHQTSLYDHLMDQLKLEHLSDKEYRVAKELIQHIDKKGYITSYASLKKTLCEKHQLSERKLLDILKVIQSFEPDGIGARTLKECLLIQLKHQSIESERLEATIENTIKYHLDALSKGEYEQIAEDLDIEAEGVEVISLFIKQNLNPTPAAQFHIQPFNQHIIPSFNVAIENNTIKLTNLEQSLGIKLNLSQHYLNLLEDPNTDTQTKLFLKEKLEKANDFIQTLNNRKENLDSLATYITKHQKQFLQKGPAFLKPLLQKEVAEALDLSPSTVSRILSSKYIQTPQGTFALKQLCPRSHFGKTSQRLQEVIKTLVQEDPKLSDEKLRKKLKELGIKMARRTVTKYRLLAGIEASFTRKKESH